jgi:beta-lactam-binding protein with PASTA domain
VSVVSKGFSAIGKLIFVGVLLAAFLASMAGVVYMSLSGAEVKVPDITGKDFVESEKELASLGLKIRRRADRESADPINTVIEQLPKPGETVKSGQWISVVVSKAGLKPEETPSSLKKDTEEDDSKKIEEMISDKPKKARTNSNTNANTNKKTADTTRDTIANTSTSTANDTKSDAGDAKKDPAGDKKDPDKTDKQDTPKPLGTPGQGRPSSARPPANQRP